MCVFVKAKWEQINKEKLNLLKYITEKHTKNQPKIWTLLIYKLRVTFIVIPRINLNDT